MSFWDLDEKAQLALLMAGVLGTTGAAGCDRNVADPVPPDASVDARDSLVADMVPPDARADVMISDPVPPDAKIDVMVSDMAPPDAKIDVMVSDMAPPDAKIDVMVSDMAPPDAKVPDGPMVVDPPPPDAKVPDVPPIADPLPPDASAPYSSPPRRAPGRKAPLPLSRDFRTRIKAVISGDQVQLHAVTRGVGNPAMRHQWIVSGGTLDRADRQKVHWTLPTTPGRHMAQGVVRDGRGSMAVDIYLHEVK